MSTKITAENVETTVSRALDDACARLQQAIMARAGTKTTIIVKKGTTLYSVARIEVRA
jgi:hypothetical protein